MSFNYYNNIDWAADAAVNIAKDTAKDLAYDLTTLTAYLSTKPGFAKACVFTGITAAGLLAPLAVSWLTVRTISNAKVMVDRHYNSLETEVKNGYN